MSKKEYLNYDELLKKAQEKKRDYEEKAEYFDKEADIKKIITVRPSAELAAIEHYNSIKEVEISPDITTFWQSQQTKIDQINMEPAKNKYMSAFKDYQDFTEDLEDTKRNGDGIEDFNIKEKELKENLKEAKKKVKHLQYDVSPFSVLLGAATGTNSDSQKVKDALKGVSNAKKQLEAIRERRREQQKAYQQAQDKISVRQKMAQEKMLDALEEMAKEKDKAEAINKGSIDIHDKLEKQYKIVDMYTSIQSFKKSNDYLATKNLLEISDPELANDLERLPSSLPEGSLKISIENPLTLSSLPINQERITEIDEKVNELKGKLPKGIDMNNLSGEIENYKLTDHELENPGLAYSKLEKELDELDKMGYSPEEKDKKKNQLEMKMDHLKTLASIEETKDSIKKTIEEINNTPSNDPSLKAKYDTLTAQKGKLNLLQEQLGNDEYTQTNSNLQELDSLLNEKEQLEAPQQFQNMDEIDSKLENSQVMTSKGIISNIYGTVKNRIEEMKKDKIEKIEDRINPKRAIEKKEEQQEQDDEGR